jgi:hypothetical protein
MRQKEKSMRDQILLTITVITDDDTGIYQVGELDFGKTGHCETFLAKAENREMFVEHLRWLADAAENGTSPFLPHNKRLNDTNQTMTGQMKS